MEEADYRLREYGRPTNDENLKLRRQSVQACKHTTDRHSKRPGIVQLLRRAAKTVGRARMALERPEGANWKCLFFVIDVMSGQSFSALLPPYLLGLASKERRLLRQGPSRPPTGMGRGYCLHSPPPWPGAQRRRRGVSGLEQNSPGCAGLASLSEA